MPVIVSYLFYLILMSGVTGSLIGGIGSATAHFTNKSYAKLMSTSAKTSIPVMAGLLLFSWRYEVAMHDAMRYTLFILFPVFSPLLFPVLFSVIPCSFS